MQDLTQIKALALKYLEGNISEQDEIVLFDFIKQSDTNMSLFRSWESEWIASVNLEQLEKQTDWEKVKAALCLRQISQTEKDQSKLKVLSFWRVVSTVAAIGLLVLGIGLVLNYQNTVSQAQLKTTVQAPKGEKSKIILYDGTVVWLNSDSKLTYPSINNKSKFIVKLDGEAYFEVAKNSDRTFIVETESYDIQVKGTKFNVSAYRDDEYITTTLVEGAINIHYKDQMLNVVPNETVQLNVKTGKMNRFSENTSEIGAWTRNYILYEDITLADLVVKLSRQYGIDIYLDNQDLELKSLTLSLRNDETIEDVMNAIEKVLPVVIQREGNKYQIKEK